MRPSSVLDENSSRRRGNAKGVGQAAFLAVLFALWSQAAVADKSRLETIQRQLEQDKAKAQELDREAKALREEIGRMQLETVEVARRAQDLEEELTNIEGTLEALKAEEADRLADLQTRRVQLAGTLAALQRLAAQPPEALIAAPGSPLETVRSAMLLRVAVPAIEDRADRLRAQLHDLALVRGQIATEQAELSRATAALDGERSRLTGLIERKKELERSTLAAHEEAQERAQRLAGEAKDLRDLLQRLERIARLREDRLARDRALREAHLRAEREARAAARRNKAERELAEKQDRERAAQEQAEREPEAARRETETARAEPEESLQPTPVNIAKPANVRSFPGSPRSAALVVPARGKLVVSYGEREDGADETSKGVTIEARASSQVVAPYDGKIVYAGHFRGYGQILIIEHGGRYHSLLAGLDQIDGVVGQWVLAGEPVGVMSGTPGGKPRLYMELRRTGQPINPLPWLAANVDKVQG